MKTFLEFCEEQEYLNEGLVRSGAIVAYASRARVEGQQSDKAFRRGVAELSKRAKSDDVETRLERIEDVLEDLLIGLAHQRKQISNASALDVAGHLLSSRTLQRVERAIRKG